MGGGGVTTAPLAIVLADKASSLSPMIRDLHLGNATRRFAGQVTVKAGAGLARFAAKLAGFPQPMQDAPFRLEIAADDRGERWTRWFGPCTTTSTLRATADGLEERFGPITTVLQPAVKQDGRLSFTTGAARFLIVPLPQWLAPQGRVAIWEREDRYHFDITGDLPAFGRAIRYVGWLAPEAA